MFVKYVVEASLYSSGKKQGLFWGCIYIEAETEDEAIFFICFRVHSVWGRSKNV